MGESQGLSEGRRAKPFQVEAPVPCPECGGAHWLVGRHIAECAACAAPLPRADGAPVGLPRPRLLRRAA